MATYKVCLIDEDRRVLGEKTIKAMRNYDAIEAAETSAGLALCPASRLCICRHGAFPRRPGAIFRTWKKAR
jgi:hypothetical protein